MGTTVVLGQASWLLTSPPGPRAVARWRRKRQLASEAQGSGPTRPGRASAEADPASLAVCNKRLAGWLAANGMVNGFRI